MTRRRIVGAIVVLAIGAVATLVALRFTRTRAAAAEAASEDPLVPTTHVTRGPLELSVHATGELRASKSAMLIAPSVGGTLRILRLLETGAAVKSGDVIAELDPTEQLYALEQAKSELAEAEQQIVKKKADLDVQTAEDDVTLLTAKFDVRRAELDNLADKDLISANAFAKNQLELDEAKHRLEQVQGDVKNRVETNRAALALVEEKRAKAQLSATRAQQNIDTLVIKAPIDGLVVVRENRDASGGFYFSGMSLPSYRSGDNTFAGRPLADVYDLSGMELRVKVGEQDRANVMVGQDADVWSDALAGVSLKAKVSAIAGLTSSDFFDVAGPVRQFDVTLKLDTADSRLRPGTSVNVVLRGRTVDGILQVPMQAVRLKNGKPAVFVKNGTGFESKEVKVVFRTETRVGLEGLTEGAVVALVESGGGVGNSQWHEAGGVGAGEMSGAAVATTAPVRRNARGGLDVLPEIRQGLDNLRAHKLRSALTMLGMIFGVAAVIAMLSIGAGAQQQVIAFIEQLGVHNVIVEAREAGDSQTLQRVRKISAGLSFQDLRSIQSNVDGIVASTARKRLLPTKLLPKAQGDLPMVYGVSPPYEQIAGLKVTRGRFFSDDEDKSSAPVCVLGQAATASLFGGTDPIGQFVKVNQQWFRVIGVAGPQLTAQADVAGLPAQDRNNLIYIPLTSALLRLEDSMSWQKDEIDAVYVTLNPAANVVSAGAVMRGLLDTSHRGASDFSVIVPAELLAEQQRTKRLFEIVMVAIASISLLVGGIGIMNIMLASVMERTKEIGVRRAIGATRRAIVRQFLVETTMITVTGGFIGTIVGIVLSQLVAYFAGWSTIVSVTSVAIACIVSVSIGIVFGLYPAMRAAGLDPVKALHYE